MANRPAPALVLRSGDREVLERWTRSDRFGASAAKRARIVLLAADGMANTRIAELSDATVDDGAELAWPLIKTVGSPACVMRPGRAGLGRWTIARSWPRL